MFLTVKEMELLCVMYSGTRSETLAMLREVEHQPPERMAVIEGLIEKLSGMKDGDAVSLVFETET